MEELDRLNEDGGTLRKVPLIAAAVALVGLADSIYLTVSHYRDEKVPCSITGGCEMVLQSAYATIGDIPLAVFGAFAYFTAFSFAILAAYGNRLTWKLFGLLSLTMAAFSGWLIFVQAFRIHAFCQFCLLSAATSITLFLIALFSRAWRG